MTITLSPTVLICWAAIAIVQAVYTYTTYKKSRKKLVQGPNGQMMKHVYQNVMQQKSAQLMRKKILNPFSIAVFALVFIVFSPVIFLVTLGGIFKKAIGYKTKLEKEVDAEKKQLEEAKKKHDEWLKNEGEIHVSEIINIMQNDVITLDLGANTDNNIDETGVDFDPVK